MDPQTFTAERALDASEKITELLEDEGFNVAESYAVIALLLAIMGKCEGRPIERTVETLRDADKMVEKIEDRKQKHSVEKPDDLQ